MDPQELQDRQDYQDYLAYQEYVKNSSSWNVPDAIKQFGAGAVRGTSGLVGLLADIPGALTGQNLQGGSMFPNSEYLQKAVDSILPQKDPKYRYSEMIGEFAGPSGASTLLGKALSLAKIAPEAVSVLRSFGGAKNTLLDAVSGIGAQSAEDLTGENTISPLVGAISARTGASALDEMGRGIIQRYTPLSDERIYQTAAAGMQDYTGLKGDDIRSALASMPNDELLKYKTTAEITQNAPMAQIQQQLTGTDEGAKLFAEATNAREGARQAIIDRGSAVSAVNREGLGTDLINAATDTEEKMGRSASALWNQFPRDIPIDMQKAQADILPIVRSREYAELGQAGKPLNSTVKILAEQFLSGDVLPSGALQNIREDSLAMLRDKNLSPYETRVLAALASGADEAIKQSAPTEVYQGWEAARDATKTQKEIFGQGTAGGALLRDDLRPAKAVGNSFKGDSLGVKELKSAIGGNPQLLEKYKRGVLDLLKTDTQERVTTKRMMDFLDGNEGGLIELFGQKHYSDMRSVLEDMRSADRIKELANLASKGSSPTAQRLNTAGALNKMLTSKIMPGMGPMAEFAKEIQTALGQNVSKKVNALLLRAAMDPEFAAMLADAPTQQAIVTGLQYLKRAALRMGQSGFRAGVLATGNDPVTNAKNVAGDLP